MKRVLLAIAMVVLLGFVQKTEATTITYQATDLPDGMGGDLWQYTYSVSGFVFSAGQGFTIYFDYTLYKNLESPPPPVNMDWHPLTFQPDVGLLSDGAYDALALGNPSSLANPFTVTFDWLGLGTPGAQPFELYELDFSSDPDGTPVPFDPGQTTAVPEPSTWMLLATGGAGMLTQALRRRRQRRVLG